MSKFKNWTLKKYIELNDRKEDGQGLAEYGLILALIAVVCIGVLITLGGDIATKIGAVSAGLTGS